MFFVDRGHDTCLRNVLRGSLRVTKNHSVAYQSLLVSVLLQFDSIHDEQTKPFLLEISTSVIRLMRKPGVNATVSQKSRSDDHVTVAVQADCRVDLDMADFECPKRDITSIT
jgi:hypothetical protein